TIVSEQWLRHEGSHFAMPRRDILDDVLVHHAGIGHLHKRRMSQVDFALPTGGDFVMVTFHGDPGGEKKVSHFTAQIAQSIAWGAGEQPFVNAQLRAEIRYIL